MSPELKDSKDDNERLVIIWNAVEERTDDPKIKDYAKKKVKELTDLKESFEASCVAKEELDNEYVSLIKKELREVQDYA
jgi:predicted  nucleic acid-binding Zn-ribbon protein